MTAGGGAHYDERHVPAWVVLAAVGRALGTDVAGLEPRGGDTYAVLIDRAGEAE